MKDYEILYDDLISQHCHLLVENLKLKKLNITLKNRIDFLENEISSLRRDFLND